jgi:phototropin
LTDKLSVKSLRYSINNAEETVELLLNYRKNGGPFWNLLYVSPPLDEDRNVVFFLGGQINCSTTIHSCTDILKFLSLNDEGVSERVGDLEMGNHYRPPSGRSIIKLPSVKSSKPSFFKSFQRQKGNVSKLHVRAETGVEGELIDKIGKLDFRTQVEAFYTAYSKVGIIQYLQLLRFNIIMIVLD